MPKVGSMMQASTSCSSMRATRASFSTKAWTLRASMAEVLTPPWSVSPRKNERIIPGGPT
jgi:hypothetical protein